MALLRDRHHVEAHDHDEDVSPMPVDEHGDRRDRVVVRRNSIGQTARAVIATICVLAIGALMLLNPDDVRVDVGFDRYDAPLWAAVGGAAAAGVVLGWMLGWRRCRRPHTD